MPASPKPDGATVFLANMSEDVWSFITSISDEKAREFEILENSFLIDRDLFSLSEIPNAYLISPQPLDPDFFEYVTSLTSQDVTVLVPSKHTGELCLDCIKDKKLFKQLLTIGKKYRKLTLLSYSTTFQFYELVNALRAEGIKVMTPDSPDFEHLWVVDFFGSKSGIRQLVANNKHLSEELYMADGLICSGVSQIAQIAASKYLTEGGVVIKTNKGHSGAGVLIYKPGELPKKYEDCRTSIEFTLLQDEYWDIFPAVVESYIEPDSSIGGGFPNVECRVHQSGKVEILYYCGMRVNENGVFQGVEIKDDVLPKRIRQKFARIGKLMGKLYAKHGYKGYFDIDFIAAKDGKLYLTESNIRRTGGTYSYYASKRLFGKKFMSEIYSVCDSGYRLQTKKTIKFKQIKKLLEPVLFNFEDKEGVVLSSANILRQQRIGYIVFAKDKPRALKIEKEMHRLLESV